MSHWETSVAGASFMDCAYRYLNTPDPGAYHRDGSRGYSSVCGVQFVAVGDGCHVMTVCVCDSWLKACAQKRVWSMVQCASGGHSRFSDHDLSVRGLFP